MPSTWYVLEPADICACADQMPKGEEKIQPVAVPLDTLPERRTMTIHPEISARGSLIWRWFQVAFGYLPLRRCYGTYESAGEEA